MNENKKSVDTEEQPVSAEAQSEGADEANVDDAAENSATGNSGEITIDSLKTALAAMEEKADDHWARYLRTAAEVENVRKRGQRDVEKAHKFGFEKFAGDLLGVRDSLVMGLGAAKDQATVESLVEGSEMTLKLLEQVLTRHGVTEINPLGEVFNPELHEALVMVESPDAAPNTVVEVVQTGFEINGRLLRAARVMVAKD